MLKWNHICKFILDDYGRTIQLQYQLWLFSSYNQCLCAELKNLYKNKKQVNARKISNQILANNQNEFTSNKEKTPMLCGDNQYC